MLYEIIADEPEEDESQGSQGYRVRSSTSPAMPWVEQLSMGYKAKPEFIGNSLIRELNAAKWNAGAAQSDQQSLEEGLSPFEEPTEQEQGIKI
jgi:hypothetical protein